MIGRLGLCIAAICWAAAAQAEERSAAFEMNTQFLTPPPGMRTIGDAHGDIAVSPSGEIYVSVQGGDRPGVQIYSPQGRYLRNLPHAPNDFHGFIITTAPDGTPHIYGSRLVGQEIQELTLDGKIVLTIPAASIPDRYKTEKDGKLSLSLTDVAVAPNGDIYAVDGYGRDFIHRFDKAGHYLGTFGGDGEPWNFKQCHKIAIDPRFQPVRLLCTDRLHDRLIQMNLDGHVLGVFAEGLRWPSAMSVYRDELAVAELGGRVSILDKQGHVLASIGSNENASETKTNQIPPEKWQPNLFYAPHGIAYDKDGNLLVTEWNSWGRVVRLERKPKG
jgi:DNA-binding beta-propeller fold protein YncE